MQGSILQVQHFGRKHRAPRKAIRATTGLMAGTAACALLAVAASVTLTGPALAQGSRHNDSVSVDLGVLDALGPPETLPGLLYLGTPGGPAGANTAPGAAPQARRPALTPQDDPAQAPRSRLHVATPSNMTPPAARAAPTAPPARPTMQQRRATAVPPAAKPIQSLSAAMEPVAPAIQPAAQPPAVAIEAPLTQADVSDTAPRPAPEPPALSAPTPPPLATQAPATQAPTTQDQAPQRQAGNADPSIAALPIGPGGVLSIGFASQDAALPSTAAAQLEGVAARMQAEPEAQAKILAYAADDDGNASRARRLSLSRALAARGFLIDRGVPSTRIDVRALGNQVSDGSPDRVDIQLVTP